MSIEPCQSSPPSSETWANTPRLDASLTNPVGAVQKGDHGTGSLANDRVDQIERVRGASAESNQRDVGSFAGGDAGQHL